MKYLFLLLIITVLVFSVHFSSAQNIDSLYNVLEHAETVSEKAEIHIEISVYYNFRDIDSAYFHVDKALSILKNTDEYFLTGRAYHTKGNTAWMASDLKSARSYYSTALKYYESIAAHEKMARIYYNIALTHDNTNYDSAFYYLDLSVEQAKIINDSSLIIQPQVVKISIFTKLGLLDEGLETAFKVLNYAEETKDIHLMIQAYISIANIYSRMYKTEEAVLYYHKALSVLEGTEDLYMKEVVIGNLALAYQESGDTTNFLKYGKQSLENCKKLNNPRSTFGTLINFTKHYIDSENIPQAKKYAAMAYQTVKENNLEHFLGYYHLARGNIYRMEGNLHGATAEYDKVLKDPVNHNRFELMMKTYSAYSRVDTLLGNFKAAFYHKQKEKAIQDSVQSAETEREIQGLHIRYQTAQKEQQLILLEEKNRKEQLKSRVSLIAAVSVGGILLLLLILTLIILKSRRKLQIRNREISEQREEISQQADRLKENLNKISELSDFKHATTQMLVHDLKNPLNVLLNIENIPPEMRIGLIRHSSSKMHNLVMNILEVNQYKDKNIPLKISDFSFNDLTDSIIENLKYSFQTEGVQFMNRMKKNVIVSADKYLIERMVVNIITNALKYTPEGGSIQLEAEVGEAEKVKIMFSDDGIGIPEEKLEHIFEGTISPDRSQNYSTGIGLSFCKLVCDLHKEEIGIESKPKQGTRIWFSLPLTETVDKNPANITPDIKTESLELSDGEMADLSPFAQEISNIQVEEYSKFRQLFQRMNEAGAGNKKWREALHNAVINLNQEKYDELAGMLVQKK